ncbi:MAG: DUF4835 family protein [Flavobacteriales bacterium]|nr:DUF4835 family protein [Flavobacteriales bacterium]MDW8409652.1 DUF4835 family protein [Flavobacteriales bacterium]
MQAQELRADVKVQYTAITNVDPNVFKELEKSVRDFINNTRWTTDVFQPEERIECSFFINVLENRGNDTYKASLQVSARRPVYGSTYYTPLLNIQDQDFVFTYVPFQFMEYSEQAYLSNLTGVLAFYAYYILGLDYDSFSLEGGTPYFKKAQNVVLNAQGSDAPGWRAQENFRNRYWMVEDMLNAAFKDYRKFMYEYHRNGLDQFYNDFENTRRKALEAAKLMDNVFRQRPNGVLLQIFLNAKRDELLAMCKDAPKSEIADFVNAMAKVDGAFSSKWTDLLKN